MQPLFNPNKEKPCGGKTEKIKDIYGKYQWKTPTKLTFLKVLHQNLPPKALSTAAGSSGSAPHSVPVPQCVPGERSSVLSRLPINSQKRRFDSPSPLCATLKEASHTHTCVSSCRTLTDLRANA